ncbi:MAG: tetratricopeptide repeat protein [Nitrospiraceae bacterium]|nr:tetratricopeptide repeat protein [Nitrospirota bacterium]MDA8337822.1 tetratricopeptide repeat protein [Nitrospiraceae bacterium]
MGRERIGKRKLICLFIAYLIAFTIVGCSALKERVKEKEASGHLVHAKELLAQGDYEGSLKETQKALTFSGGNPPGDEALFNMGLIYAHPKNHKKDFKKSLSFFRRLIKDYPQSPLTEQAKIWIGVLHMIEKSKQVDVEIEEMEKEMSR